MAEPASQTPLPRGRRLAKNREREKGRRRREEEVILLGRKMECRGETELTYYKHKHIITS